MDTPFDLPKDYDRLVYAVGRFILRWGQFDSTAESYVNQIENILSDGERDSLETAIKNTPAPEVRFSHRLKILRRLQLKLAPSDMDHMEEVDLMLKGVRETVILRSRIAHGHVMLNGLKDLRSDGDLNLLIAVNETFDNNKPWPAKRRSVMFEYLLSDIERAESEISKINIRLTEILHKQFSVSLKSMLDKTFGVS